MLKALEYERNMLLVFGDQKSFSTVGKLTVMPDCMLALCKERSQDHRVGEEDRLDNNRVTWNKFKDAMTGKQTGTA